jgi:hypothetical protein
MAKYGVESAVRPVPIFAVQAALALGSSCAVVGTSRRSATTRALLPERRQVRHRQRGSEDDDRADPRGRRRERLLGGSSYSSGNAVFSALLEKPQHIAIVDEFGKYLEAASSGATRSSQDASRS